MDDNVVGLDISLTSTGIATASGEYNVFTKPDAYDHPMERYHTIRNEIIARLQLDVIMATGDKPIVLIEGYAFAKRSSHAHAQGELGGIVRSELWLRGYRYIEVPPTSLKKFTTGKGNANKNDMVSSVTLRTGREWSGKGADDRVDAWALRHMALAATSGDPDYDWPKINLEALEKIDWTPFGE
jgi:Holliday junction resolvasome RuvABC endonuclease subunit